MRMFLIISALILGLGNYAKAGTADDVKRPMTMDDVRSWQRITHRNISDNGLWVAVTTEGWCGDGDRNGRIADYAGDALLNIYDAKGNVAKAFNPIKGFRFSNSSNYAIVVTHETEASRNQRALKEQNKKSSSKDKGASGKSADSKDKAPMDTLWIYSLGRNCEQIDSLRNYKLAESSDWIAYQTGRKDSTLYVRTLDNSKTLKFDKVTEYGFAKDKELLYYIISQGKKPDTLSLFAVNLSTDAPQLIKQTTGRIEKVTMTEDGALMAFMHSNAKKDAAKNSGMSLWIAKTDGSQPAEQLSDSVNAAFTPGWILSSNSGLRFSKAGDKLAFGVAPADREKDTLTLKSERPEVQVWSWNEPEQYTVQDFNKARNSRKTYDAVVLLDSRKVVQIADKELDNVITPRDMVGSLVILSNSKPYSNSSMWEGRSRRDYYVMNIETGERRLLSKADYTGYRFSPSGKYAYGYADTDSVWRTINLETLQKCDITSPKTFVAWDEENDVPDYPSSYGIAGWLPNDEALLIYDRYDIWRVPAQGGAMVNLTKNGREQKIQYRLLQLDHEKAGDPLNPAEVQYLSAFDENTKGSAFYRTKFQKPAAPVFITGGNYRLSAPTKAKNADKVLFTREAFEYAPDVYFSDLKLRNPVQITHLVDQQNPFVWGTAELIEWTSYKGVKLQGVIYKPANFDPSKKYPLIVNFYERNSETLYDYRSPQPHRSTPDYHTYNSNGYVVFNPDVRYVDGHPGESCYDCVLSGLDKVLSLGYIDEKRVGASGHSWGGYQLAYLATRTDRFAAIESGAPVVNMFSAYGGIRWGSGMARAFQYEHTQSRIGASPWESPELYKENSALFTMDKVKTPILIMHNDTDGHVPWYQGIEYFVAMKRLGKPCWMLNYTGEPHWPVRMANRLDFQKRLMQFFDHFLKDAEMPKWMKDGIPAVDQPYELGY